MRSSRYSERARLQWELEGRFLNFESAQRSSASDYLGA